MAITSDQTQQRERVSRMKARRRYTQCNTKRQHVETMKKVKMIKLTEKV